MYFGIFSCAMGLYYWFIGHKFEGNTLRTRLQTALQGNVFFLAGLYSIGESPPFALGQAFLNWLLVGGVLSAIGSIGILAYNWKERSAQIAAKKALDTAMQKPETISMATRATEPARDSHIVQVGRNR